MAYNAFISYSHAADGKFAPALQRALRQFARPWNRLRALRIFRDTTNLSISPNLWESVRKALSESEFFILLASPRAAASSWVAKEVEYWLSQRTLDSLLIVLTEGELLWGAQENSTVSALPPALLSAIKAEPLYVDMRWARSELSLSLNNPAFRDQVATIAAALRGQSKDDLIGEDVAQHRKFKRFVAAVIGGLALTTVGAMAAGWVAWNQRSAAIARGVSTAALVRVSTDPQLGVLLALEGCERARDGDAVDVLREVLIKARIRREFEAVVDQALIRQGQLQSRAFDEAVTGAQGKSLASLESSRNGLRAALYSPDGALLILGMGDGGAEVMDARTLRPIATLESMSGAVDRIAVSPDSRLVLTASTDERYGIALERTAHLSDAHSGKLIATLSGHLEQVEDIGFSADSRLAVTRSADGSTFIWNAESGQTLVTNDQNGLVIPSLLDRGVITLIAGEADTSGDGAMTVRNLGFSPDGHLLVTVDREGKGKLWDVREARLLHAMWNFTDNIRHAFAFSRYGAAVFGRDADTASAWDVRTGTRIESPPPDLAAELQEFLRTPAPDSSDTVHMDARLILDQSKPGNALLKERATGIVIAIAPRDLVAVALHPDGLRMATAVADSIEVRLTRREVDATPPELIRLARAFVSRGLSAAERAQYLR